MTDNPSGSTGQNVTTPPNAPEAGSNGERDALARIIFRAREWAADPEMAKLLADQCIAAGFTRAHHGETVAPVINRVAAGGHRPWTDAEQVSLATHAMRDAGLSPDDLDVYQAINRLRAERDAAIARAEAAEAKLAETEAEYRAAYKNDMHHRRELVAANERVAAQYMRADAAEARLLKLIDAMQHIASHNLLSHEVVPYASAALAGNGNGTGEGDGWIACRDRLPDDPREVLVWADDSHIADDGSGIYVDGWTALAWRVDSRWFDSATSKEWAHEQTIIMWREIADRPNDEQQVAARSPLPAAPPSAGETNHADA